jgi:hypothetical protein
MRLLTLDDIELFYLGKDGHPFVGYDELLEITKAAGEVSTQVTGILNATYGAYIWRQLNSEANAFGILPKTTWFRTGWRIMKAFATASASDIILSSEIANLPAPVRPEIDTVRPKPKIHAEVFDVTDIVEALATSSVDDLWGALSQVRVEIGAEFIKRINQLLLRKVAEADSAWNGLTSLDRIVGHSGEDGAGTNYDVVYGIDRTTNPWANAYVNYAGTPRAISDALIRDVLMGARTNGGNTNVILTGYDTFTALSGLYMTFVRYLPMGETAVQVGVNGISTASGIDAGIRVASLYGVPVIQSVDAPKGIGSGEISYLFALDTSDPEGYGVPRLGLSVLRPVEYFETGAEGFAYLNKFVRRGIYRFVGETAGRLLAGQGKLRDITA